MFHDALPGTVDDAQEMESAARGRTNAQLALHDDRGGVVRDARGMVKGPWGTEKDLGETQRDTRGIADGARGVDDGVPAMDDGAAGAERAPRSMYKEGRGAETAPARH